VTIGAPFQALQVFEVMVQSLNVDFPAELFDKTQYCTESSFHNSSFGNCDARVSDAAGGLKCRWTWISPLNV
jgi:hypothetical protein